MSNEAQALAAGMQAVSDAMNRLPALKSLSPLVERYQEKILEMADRLMELSQPPAHRCMKCNRLVNITGIICEDCK